MYNFKRCKQDAVMARRKKYQLILFSLSFFFFNLLLAQKQPKAIPPLSFTNGKLNYTADSLGNRIPDFSYCGYKASEQAIPSVTIKIVVPLIKGDATNRIKQL